MELPETLYTQIEAFSEQGNDMMDADDPAAALIAWRKAYGLLPEPRSQWEAALWLQASMAEAHYLLGDFAATCDAMRDALNTPGGNENPYVHYMLGKALLRLEDEKAVDALMAAYKLDGTEIFDSDDEEGADTLQILQNKGLIDD